MPEYLAPGVYVEEISARQKAIEGSDTSTAGFVGVTERGPVAGLPLPFAGDIQGFGVPADPAPVLIDSYVEFTRIFGNPRPLPDPNNNGYLARAVRGFFENGGKRCFIARIVGIDTTNPANAASTAKHSTIQIGRGIRLLLARRIAGGTTATVVPLTSLRGITMASTLIFRSRLNPNNTLHASPVTSIDTARGEITLAMAVPAGTILEPEDTFVALSNGAFANEGPLFYARSPGSWSAGLRVQIANADREPVPVVAPAAKTATQMIVASSASFYRGAIIEVTNGTDRATNEVAEVLPGNTLQLRKATGLVLSGGNNDFARVLEIDINVTNDSGAERIEENFRALAWNQRDEPGIHSRHYATIVNAKSQLVYVRPPGVGMPVLPGTESADLAGQPMTATGFSAGISVSGGDGNAPTDNDYVGVDNGFGLRTGIQSLAGVDDIRIIAVPGRTSALVHNALITQCEHMRYRFAVLDGECDPAGGSINSVLAHRDKYDTSFAAYYTPWVEVVENNQRLLLPPSGHIAGIYARTDVERGVWKAPANEVVRSIAGLRSYITDTEQRMLNPRGVNCIRRFEGRGLRVWGARTLSSDVEFHYINVRRFLIFLGASIDRGTQYVVFEPNTPETWKRVSESVSSFLFTLWHDGALAGSKPEEAYFVRCDESTMMANDVHNGRLICLIGVAILRPAEFIYIRIQQTTSAAG